MKVTYYNSDKKYSVDELKKIYARLKKDIEGCQKLRTDLQGDGSFAESDDAIESFLNAAAKAKAEIEKQFQY